MSWPEAFAIVGTLAASVAIIWAFAWSQKNSSAAPNAGQVTGITAAELGYALKRATPAQVIEYLEDDVNMRVALSIHFEEQHDEMAELVGLLDEVRSHFTRDDDLPNDLLPRIDAALAAQQQGGSDDA